MIKARIEYEAETCEDGLKKSYVISAELRKAGFDHSFVCGHHPEHGFGAMEFFYGADNTAPNQNELESIIRNLNIGAVRMEITTATPLEVR